MKTAKEFCCQGDVSFQKVDSIPDGYTVSQTGRVVCAHSETGHDHCIEDKYTERLDGPADPFVCYLRIAGEYADVVHNRSFHTHETIRLPKGIWKVRRQTEHTPEGLRQVQD